MKEDSTKFLLEAAGYGQLYDLEAYRKRRLDDGSWPPDELTVREYWQRIKDRRKTSK